MANDKKSVVKIANDSALGFINLNPKVETSSAVGIRAMSPVPSQSTQTNKPAAPPKDTSKK